MECEYCGRNIVDKPVKKTMRGKKYHFCTEMCFRFSYWQVPGFDLKAVYEKRTISLECPDFQELIKFQEEQ